MNAPSDRKLSEQLNDLIQEAVDNAVDTHHQKGESIAVSDENGKVKIVSAQEIPEFKKRLDKE